VDKTNTQENAVQAERKPTEREIRLEMLQIMRSDGYEVGKDGRGQTVALKEFFTSLMAENVRAQALKNLAERVDEDVLGDESLGLEDR
jgi:hypothetical protein